MSVLISVAFVSLTRGLLGQNSVQSLWVSIFITSILIKYPVLSRGWLDRLFLHSKDFPPTEPLPWFHSHDWRCLWRPWVCLPFLPRILTLFHSHAPIFSIISVSSYTAVLSRPDLGRDKIKERRPPPSEKGTWLGFLFKLFLLAGVVAGGYYGYQEYLRRQMYGGGGNFGGFTEMFSGNNRRYWMRSVRRKLTRVPVLCIYLASPINSFVSVGSTVE